MSRGIRNNNPGNIRHSKDKWQGASKAQTDKAFVQFDSPVYGIRAIARLLIRYQDHHDLRTVAQLIRRWAPPAENATRQYAAFVADRMGVGPNQVLDMHRFEDLRGVVEGIIDFENEGVGVPYTAAQIDKALALAGVEKGEARALVSTRTGKGGAVAVTSTSLTAVLEPAQAVFHQLAPYLKVAQYGLMALAVAGVVWMLWARLDDMRRLARP